MNLGDCFESTGYTATGFSVQNGEVIGHSGAANKYGIANDGEKKVTPEEQRMLDVMLEMWKNGNIHPNDGAEDFCEDTKPGGKISCVCERHAYSLRGPRRGGPLLEYSETWCDVPKPVANACPAGLSCDCSNAFPEWMGCHLQN